VKRPILALLTLALLAGVSFAQPLVLSQRPADGTYVLTVQGATVTLQKATMLQIGPVDPDDPVDPVTDIVAEVKAEVEKIPVNDSRHQSAIKLTAMYRFLAANVRNGTIPKANIGQAVNAYLGFLLAGDNRWGGVTQKIAGYLATCTSPASCADVLEEAANGILQSVPEPLRDDVDEIDIPVEQSAMGMDSELAGKAGAYGINWETLFELLLKLLPIIIQLFAAVEACLPYVILA
jgi:hypothetical protein